MEDKEKLDKMEKAVRYFLIPLFLVLLIAFFVAFANEMNAYTRSLAIASLVVGVALRLLRVKIKQLRDD